MTRILLEVVIWCGWGCLGWQLRDAVEVLREMSKRGKP